MQKHSKLTRLSALTVTAVFGMVALAGTASAQLSKDDNKCVGKYNKAAGKVAQTAGKEAGGCVKTASKGGSADLGACITADAKGKIASSKTKIVDCTIASLSLPIANAGNIAEAAGADLATSLLGVSGSLSGDKADNKCQAGALKNTSKTFDTKVKEFNKCKKGGDDKLLEGDGSEISACLTSANGSAKAAKAAGKITSDIAKNCGAVIDLSALFPGDCAQPALDVATLATCAEGLTDTALGTFGGVDGPKVSGP